jgi:hypothetical protein
MLRPALLLASLSVLLVPPQTAPPMPFVDEGACPYECCIYRDWTATAPVVAYDYHPAWESLEPGTPHKTMFSVAKGEVVTALTGVVVTTRPGRMRFTEAISTTNSSRRFPRMASEHVAFAPGDTLYLLAPQGEGVFTAWFKGRLLEGLDTVPLQERIGWHGSVLEAKPTIQWWVRIRNANGQFGWTDRPVDFKNRDACGR